MKKIVLISCVSKKKTYETTAEDLYDSPLFKYALQYAKLLKPDKIFILSALYGLLETRNRIKPYNKTLNEMNTVQKKEWSNLILDQMKNKGINLENDHFILLAGNNYRKYIMKHISHYDIPLEGKGIGKQLAYLKRMVEGEFEQD